MRHRVSALVVTAGACLIAAALGPQPAGADGLPVYEVDTSRQGIETSSATARYVALPAGEGTSVARIDADGGRVRRSTFLEGDFTVPAVAYDGTTSGLSHDGKVLALIEPRKSFPRPTTGFVLLDAERMRTLEQVRLDGDFSFDAISPNGETIYLIEYLDRRDPTNYRVRAYDVDRGSLVAGAIVDPREPSAEMAGLPATRVVSPEGRWAYTLYQRGGGDEPFIHALDTRRGEAVCIDLEGFASRVMGFELLVAPGDGQLTLSDGQAEPIASIDPETREVTSLEPATPAGAMPPAGAAGNAEGSDDGLPVLAAGLLALVAAGLAGLLLIARRARRPRDPEMPLDPELEDAELPARRVGAHER